MKVVQLSSKVELQYINLFEQAKDAIRAYKSNHDISQFKSNLCKIVDESPHVALLDPDVLSCYDLDYDESQWVEFTDDEEDWSKGMLKNVINDYDSFEPCQLTLGSSGSIMITLFGDAYHELR